MSPELKVQARKTAVDELPATIDEEFGFLAASTAYKENKFRNHFGRDAAISIAQSFLMPENYGAGLDFMVPTAIKTIETMWRFQSGFDFLSGAFPGSVAHEAHNKRSDQNRLIRLREEGWPVSEDKDGYLSMVVYAADDNQALSCIASERVIRAVENAYSPQEAQKLLTKWWPNMENSLLHDLYVGDRDGQGLLISLPSQINPLANKTWRDSNYSYSVDKSMYDYVQSYSGSHGQVYVPKPPYSFLANNCFYAEALRVGSVFAKQLGLVGFAQVLEQKSKKTRDLIHEKFWLPDQNLFAPMLGGDGRPVPIVTNESAIALFTQTAYPEYAAKVADRMFGSDLITPYGTRTRSIDDPEFTENEDKSYQVGMTWPQIDTMFALGCDMYGLYEHADRMKDKTIFAVADPAYGCSELFGVTRDGVRYPYTEKARKGVPVSCLGQSWVIHGVLGITANSKASSVDLSLAA